MASVPPVTAAPEQENILVRLARALMARESHKLGIPEQEQRAALADSEVDLRRAQAAYYLGGGNRRTAAPPDVGSKEYYFLKKYGPNPTPEQISEGLAELAKANQPPQREPAAPTNLEAQAAAALAAGDNETYQRLLRVRKEMGQADDRPRSTNVTITPTAESNIVNRLVAQWDKAAGPARELTRQSKLMDAGLAAARRGDMAAGSQAVLVTFQKILDPTSVVRESEYARSSAGQALLARIEGAAQRISQGGAGVPLAELEKFANLAREFVAASSGDYLNAQKARIGRTAAHYKIPPDLIFEDMDYGPAAAPQAAPATGGAETRVINGATYRKVPGGWQKVTQ